MRQVVMRPRARRVCLGRAHALGCARVETRERRSMISRFVVIVACTASLLGGATHSASAQRLQKVRSQVEQRIARHQGTVGLWARDLTTGETLSIRGNEQFPSASVIKVPILVELFYQVE